MNVWPPTAIVPALGGPGLALTVKVMFVLPVPDAGLVTTIQSIPDATVQAHDAPVVSANVPPPPAASTAWLDGEIE